MLKSDQIQLAQSQRRQKMSEIQSAETISDEARAELRSLTESYANAETEYRAALILEQAERDKMREPDKAGSDFARECRAFSLSAVVGALTEGKQLDGREAEVAAELEQRHGAARQGIFVPYEAMLEQRADAVVEAPDASSGELASRPTLRALERLFEASAAQKFGFRTIAVTGQPRFPSLDSGASASWVAEGAGSDAAGISTSVQTPTLRTLTARYKLSRQATKQNSALEPMLRRDLSEVMREAMDAACFTGTGADNQPSGLETLLSSPTDFSAVVTYSNVVDWAIDMMTATKSADMAGISIAGVPFVLGNLLQATFGDVLTQYDQAKKVVPSMVFSSQVSAVTSGTPDTANAYIAKAGQHAWVPVWGPTELVIDPYSESKTGHIAITSFMFADVLVQRASTHFKRFANVQRA